MNIPLNDGYRLSADKYQWIIQKHKGKDKHGEDRWESLNFHPSPEAAIKFHANQMIRTSEAETLQEALNQIERVVTELTHALNGTFDIKRTEECHE